MKCVEKQSKIPFKVISKCIYARQNLFDNFICTISGFPVSKIEHKCVYYEKEVI